MVQVVDLVGQGASYPGPSGGGTGNTPPVSPPQGNDGGDGLRNITRWRRWRSRCSWRSGNQVVLVMVVDGGRVQVQEPLHQLMVKHQQPGELVDIFRWRSWWKFTNWSTRNWCFRWWRNWWRRSAFSPANAGTANTGGGGGGSGGPRSDTMSLVTGGSGIVVIRYKFQY